MKKAWQTWLNIAKKFMNFWANVFLTLFFIVLIIPFSLILQLFFKQALLGHSYQKRNKTFWIKRQKIAQDLRWAQEQ